MRLISKFSLVLLLIAASRPVALAQLVGAVVPPDTLAVRPAPLDTVAALHRFYTAQRHKRSYVVGATALLVGIGLIPDGSPKAIISQRVAVAFLGLPVLGAELLYYNAYNRKREQRAIDAFQAHRLPRSLQRRLKARYFREPTAQ
ncbi:hypothetical protein FNT36_17355 [Hymenobacter setariae]|uniref:Uncharacterized protein n=1 Tax=Hymenobacter setariae TaxID=2594794 RepID=A0A558BSC1_9BACT|nr:hypothetical protein [Hymenobacter setariae]TVT39418.1 hypothetical protein FNT36_17355 [Hymenobacter setariae]